MLRAATVAVWDRPVRVLHWALVAAVAAAWCSTLAFGGLHQLAGWLALAVVVARCLWGVFGSAYARFAQFVRAPAATWTYLRLWLRGLEPRYIGHNPLGGWMVLALLACVAGLALTGWLYTTDALWGNEVVDDLHQSLAWALLALIALHVGGVVVAGWRHGENLVRSMVDGVKRAPAEGDRR